MGKNFKCVSHIERMLDEEKCKHARCIDVPIDTVYKVNKVVKDGRVVSDLERTTVDPRDNFKGYKVSDFSIEMLQATGAIANVKPITLDGGSISNVDSLVSTLDTLDSINVEEK